MFIRLFVDAHGENEALQLAENGLNDAKEYIFSKEIQKIEPYWKTENTFVVELSAELQPNMLPQFLAVFSDTWIEFGSPANELLASRSHEACKYIKAGFQLINIIL